MRYRLRRGHEKLSEEESQQLWAILLQESELLMAYLLKGAFRDWYKLQNPSEAAQRKEILNYFAWRYTNAFTEGKNKKFKLIKRQGYGYGNFDNFRLRTLTQAA